MAVLDDALDDWLALVAELTDASALSAAVRALDAAEVAALTADVEVELVLDTLTPAPETVLTADVAEEVASV